MYNFVVQLYTLIFSSVFQYNACILLSIFAAIQKIVEIEGQKLYKDQNNALQTFRKDLIPVFEETFSKPCATAIVRKEKLTSNNYI